MGDEMLGQVKARIRELEGALAKIQPELADLQAAERTILRLQRGALVGASVADAVGRPRSLTDAVWAALRTMGPLVTPGIIEWVKQHYKTDASPDSIRSILSHGKADDKCTRDSKTGLWAIKEESPASRS